jgi:hypothetical protein
MSERDFESKLDDALRRLMLDVPVDDLTASEPDAADLIRVARRLQVLAPTPAPQLADGRRRFLSLAARRLDRGGSIVDWFRRTAPRPALAFAVALVALLVAASAMIFSQSNPALQMTLTQTVAPTFTATPTRISFSPDGARSVDLRLSIDSHDLPLPNPQPVPAPVISAIKLTAFHD